MDYGFYLFLPTGGKVTGHCFPATEGCKSKVFYKRKSIFDFKDIFDGKDEKSAEKNHPVRDDSMKSIDQTWFSNNQMTH